MSAQPLGCSHVAIIANVISIKQKSEFNSSQRLVQNSGIRTSTCAGPGRRRSLRRCRRRRRRARAQPLLGLQPRRALPRSLTQLHGLIQVPWQRPAKIRVPPCSASFVPLRRAAPESWTVARARAPSASSTPFSYSWRARCYDAACPNAASRYAFPRRRRLCCHPRSPLRLRRLCCPRPRESAKVFRKSKVNVKVRSRRGTGPVSVQLWPPASNWRRSRAQHQPCLSSQQYWSRFQTTQTTCSPHRPSAPPSVPHCLHTSPHLQLL